MQYWDFYRRAKTRYRIHSPALYKLTENIFHPLPKRVKKTLNLAEKWISENDREINLTHFGAGKAKNLTATISRIHRRRSISGHDRRVLYHLTKNIAPSSIIELGTSLGLSTLILSIAAPDAEFYSVEGDPQLAGLAQAMLTNCGADVNIYNNRFESALPKLLHQAGTVEFVFLDGDHTSTPTKNYIEAIKMHLSDNGVIVIHDIFWSEEIYRCWKELRKDAFFSGSIELSTMGILTRRNIPAATLCPLWMKPWEVFYCI